MSKKIHYLSHCAILLSLMSFIVACVTNPVTGNKALVLTSEQQEDQLGEEAFQEVLAKYSVANAPKQNAILQRVGHQLAVVANKPDYHWRFVLLRSEERNAFCLPGGKVAVFTGLMKNFRDSAELAAVLGHEIGHATARHTGQRMTLLMGETLAFETLNAILGGEMTPKKKLLFEALGLGSMVGLELPFNRGQEAEADKMGLIYMARAGYTPKAAVNFWRHFAKQSGGSPPEFLSTHPSSESRETRLKAQLSTVMPLYAVSAKYGYGVAMNGASLPSEAAE